MIGSNYYHCDHHGAQQKKVELFKFKKFLAVPVIALPLVLGLGGIALAANPTDPPPALPAGQVALTGTCLTPTQVAVAVQQALSAFSVAPAGVVVNGSWIPADAVANFQQYIGGCAVPLWTSTLLTAPDQISLTGYVTSEQVAAAAQDAIDLYVPGEIPAGVLINGNWVPAGIALTYP